MLPAKFASL